MGKGILHSREFSEEFLLQNSQEFPFFNFLFVNWDRSIVNWGETPALLIAL